MNQNETNYQPKLHPGHDIDRYWRHKESGVSMEIQKQFLVDGLKRRVFYRNAVEVGLQGDEAPTYSAWLKDFEKTHEPMGCTSDDF
jgi:hypothetical protein